MARKKNTGRIAGAKGRTVSEAGSVFKREEWALQAYRYVDEIGEIAYLGHLTANTVARGQLLVQQFTEIDDQGQPVETEMPDGELDPKKTYEWADNQNPDAKLHMENFKGRTGGQRELKRRAALGLWVAGEAHLLGIPDDETDEINYEFLSVVELKNDDEGNMVRLGVRGRKKGVDEDIGGNNGEPIDGSTFYQRLHRPHFAVSGDADSPVKRVLSICRELLLLTQMVEAQAKSRLSAGILYVPDEISFDHDDQFTEGGGAGDSDDLDPVEESLIGHVSAPIEDRTSVASLAPLVMRGPADMADKIRLIDIARPITNETSALRKEALERIAGGLDVPPELLSGKGKANHWSAVSVDKDFLVKHVTPIGDLIADFVTESYLRPALIENGMSPEQARWFRVSFDISNMLGREDAGAASRAVFDRGELSADSLLRAGGFDPELDAPDDEERVQRLLVKLITTKAAAEARASIVLLGEMGVLEGLNIVIPEAHDDPQSVEESGDDDGDDEDPDEGDGEDNDDVQTRESPSNEAANTVGQIHAAAEMAMSRAIEKAASRIMSAANKASHADRDRMRAVPKPEVLSMAGHKGLTEMNLSTTQLFEGAWDELSTKGRKWLRERFVAAGIDRLQADEDAAYIMNEICMNLELLAQVAFETPFYEDKSGWRVPRLLIEESLGLAVDIV